MANFMFQIFRNTVDIVDDSKQTRDVQVFIAVRKNFARDDVAFLRYKLFSQMFGKLTEQNFNQVVTDFAKANSEIKYQLDYPRKDRIFKPCQKTNSRLFNPLRHFNGGKRTYPDLGQKQ